MSNYDALLNLKSRRCGVRFVGQYIAVVVQDAQTDATVEVVLPMTIRGQRVNCFNDFARVVVAAESATPITIDEFRKGAN